MIDMRSTEPYIKCAKECGYKFHKTLDMDGLVNAQDWRKTIYNEDAEWEEVKFGLYYYEDSFDFHKLFLDFLPKKERVEFESRLRELLIDFINEHE